MKPAHPRLLVIFPQAENVHLTKDVGMIPYILHRHEGYDSTVATYRNGQYSYLEKEVKGLKVAFIKKIFGNELLDGIWHILKNRDKYDVVMTYNLTSYYKIWLFLFKILRGKRGKTYLKLDANLEFKNFKINEGKLGFINKALFRKIDLITIETLELYHYTNNRKEITVSYLPNGFYDYCDKKIVSGEEKENWILTVGRIGDENKSNEILCEAFALFFEKNNNWKLKLVGPIVPEFETYITEYFLRYPHLVGYVEFTGAVYDKALLGQYYRRAKIFALTSKSEGFPLVLLEALQYGCYIVTTNITSAEDLTNAQKFGRIFPYENARNSIALFLSEYADMIEPQTDIAAIQDFAYRHFYWPEICRLLDGYLFKT